VELKFRQGTKVGGLFIAIAALLSTFLISAPAQAAPRAILVWVDAQYKDAAMALFAKGYKKRAVKVRAHDMSTIVTDLQSIDPNKAPDIILVENDQTANLASAALVIPLELTPATSRALSTVAIDSFKYGESIFGVPMQRQNVALVTNADLIPTAPKTFAKLSKLALKTVADGKAEIPFALPQGIDGDAYSTYPLFAGLGGYAYGTNSFGAINTNKIGINNKKFVKNQGLINAWNSSGLINSALSADDARAAFVAGKSPFWVTGPEDIATLKTVTFRYRITPVPTIVKGINTSPFMKSMGFMVTSFASAHKVQPASKDLVANNSTTSKAQTTFYSGSPYVGLPANSAAAAASPDRVLLAFGSAALGAIPYPNVPEWGAASASLGGAWRDSTRGGDAIPAAKAFSSAKAQVVVAQTPVPAPAPETPAIP